MKILWRSAGGLGNQIFQLLFVRLLSHSLGSVDVCHEHNSNYSRICLWDYPLKKRYSGLNIFQSLMINLRIPKVLYRLNLIRYEYVNIFGLFIVDGYFLNADSFKIFDRNQIDYQIHVLKDEINLDKKFLYESLYHLRLGDFFQNSCSEYDFVRCILGSLDQSSTVISNNDKLFSRDSYIKILLEEKKINYLLTDDFTALNLLTLFCSTKTLFSNGSSLAWASSLLSENNVEMISGVELNDYQYKNFVTLKKTVNFLKFNSEK